MRSRLIGPPRIPPNWLYTCRGTVAENKFRAAKATASIKLENVAVELIRARLQSRRDNASGQPPELRRNPARLNVEFLNGIQVWRDHGIARRGSVTDVPSSKNSPVRERPPLKRG